jgi:hypothetical protein
LRWQSRNSEWVFKIATPFFVGLAMTVHQLGAWEFKIASSRWCGTRNDGTYKVNIGGELNELRKQHSHYEERSDKALSSVRLSYSKKPCIKVRNAQIVLFVFNLFSRNFSVLLLLQSRTNEPSANN